MPRLVLNLAYLSPGSTGGMETVARAMVPALADSLPADWDLVAVVGRLARADRTGPWNDLPCLTLPLDAMQRGRWILAEQVLVPQAVRRLRGDVLHSLGNVGPFRSPVPHCVTVNDLTLHVVGKDDRSLRTRVLRTVVSQSAKRADLVVCPSSQTVHDLDALGVAARDRTVLIPYGIDEPQVAPADEHDVRSRLGLGDRTLVLSPSSRLPHKNLARLLQAHALLPAPRPLLVLPGYATPHDGALGQQATALGISGDVRWPGWIGQEDLEALYRASTLLVFPSLYEGFGLPVLEAMRRGLPVACSGRGSLAEIAADAALLFDAADPSTIAGAISRLLHEPALRRDLAERGRARAAHFTWARCGQEHVDVYERLHARR